VLPHLRHFCRLVLADEPHNPHIQFIKSSARTILTSTFCTQSNIQVLSGCFACNSRLKIKLRDFTFTHTLGIIPDPDSI
jgi:hypothetical protein